MAESLLHRVRERVRPLVPRGLWTRVNRTIFAAIGVAMAGHGVDCPCCGRSYRRFVRYPSDYCPGCGSYERQRLLCLYLERRPELVAGDVLHIAPERIVVRRFRRQARSWLNIDLDPRYPGIDRTMDLTALALPDASYDLVLCSHVLDVVDRHDDAVRELRRVTRSGGVVLVQAPARGVSRDANAYADRLAGAGLRVEQVRLPEQADERTRRRLGLDAGDVIFACRP